MRILLVGACLLVTLAGCGNVPAPNPPANVTTASTVSQPSATQSATPPPSADRATQWTMPNLVGANLQQAQDQIQKLTGNPLFLTRSHDATGKGRNQVADRNWQVCTQNIPAGTAFQAGTVIDFGAVKLGERC